MEDSRIWDFESSLWTGGADQYRTAIDESCLMVLPQPPFIMEGSETVEAVSHAPRWSSVDMTDRHIARPQEGLIVVAYKATAQREDDDAYVAHCSSTYRRLAHDVWRMVQHQQTPALTRSAE